MTEQITKSILKKEVQSIQNKLTPTVTNKQFININGSNLVFESNKNGILNYKLTNPIKLEVGDKVTLYQAFVNESGLNQDTLTLSEDVYEELKFLYYVPSQNFQGASADIFPDKTNAENFDLRNNRIINSEYIEAIAHPSLFTVTQDLTYSNVKAGIIETNQSGFPINGLPIWNDGRIINASGLSGATNIISGDNGSISYLFENYNGVYDDADTANIGNFIDRGLPLGTYTYVKPALGTANLFIKAGNYDLDALGRIITEQISGAKTTNQNQNYLTNRLYDPFSPNYCGSRTQDVFGNPKNQLIKKINKSIQAENITSKEPTDGTGASRFQFTNYRQIGNISGTAGGPGKDKTLYSAAEMFLGDFCVSSDLMAMWERNMGNSAGWASNGATGNNQAGPQFSPINAAMILKCMLPVVSDEVIDRRVINDPNEIWITGNAYKLPDNKDGYLKIVGTCHQTLWFPNSNIEVTKLINADIPAFVPGKNYSPIQDTYIGCQSFSVDYGNNRATRFSINNLHEPHKIPSVTNTGHASSFSGQQATKFNLTDEETIMPKYPIEASSGILVNNFCAATVQNTDIYKNAKQELDNLLSLPNVTVHSREYIFKEYDLHRKKFHEFYQTEQDARNAFKNTLWARLGFKYEQLGNINTQLDFYTTLNHQKPERDPYEDLLNTGTIGRHMSKGITTHNAFDFSDIQACANMGTVPLTEDTTPEDQSGKPGGAPVETIINMYSGKSHAKMGNVTTNIMETFTSNGRLANGHENTDTYGKPRGFYPFHNKNEFEILCDSQSFDADDLPDLNSGKSYYLIHSNIVKPNGLDSNGETMNLLGVMSKQNSSNDTIYSVDGVENTNTEEKVITQIEMVIKNSDGSIVPDSVIGKNSGFIIMIEKNINPETDVTMATV
ncbi:MAG: hypothetical protein ACW98D_17705 [Promethearchaeota archaeon]|jgi:hypothetical protein